MVNKKVIFDLHRIYYKVGAYNRDPLTHAENVIDTSSDAAKEIMDILGIEILPYGTFQSMDVEARRRDCSHL